MEVRGQSERNSSIRSPQYLVSHWITHLARLIGPQTPGIQLSLSHQLRVEWHMPLFHACARDVNARSHLMGQALCRESHLSSHILRVCNLWIMMLTVPGKFKQEDTIIQNEDVTSGLGPLTWLQIFCRRGQEKTHTLLTQVPWKGCWAPACKPDTLSHLSIYHLHSTCQERPLSRKARMWAEAMGFCGLAELWVDYYQVGSIPFEHLLTMSEELPVKLLWNSEVTPMLWRLQKVRTL